MAEIGEAVMGAVAIFSDLSHEKFGTPDDRKAGLVALYTVGRYSWWAEARLLAQIDIERDWCDGHETLWAWYQDFIEGNGFDRPQDSEYVSFRRQVRCGYLLARCHQLGIPSDILLGLDHIKADEVYRRLKDSSAETLQHYLERAGQVRRMDLSRLLAEGAMRRSGSGRQEASGAPGDTKAAPPIPQPTPEVNGPLDAKLEPPAPAPIPDDDRPPSTAKVKVVCPNCGARFEAQVEV